MMVWWGERRCRLLLWQVEYRAQEEIESSLPVPLELELEKKDIKKYVSSYRRGTLSWRALPGDAPFRLARWSSIPINFRHSREISCQAPPLAPSGFMSMKMALRRLASVNVMTDSSRKAKL